MGGRRDVAMGVATISSGKRCGICGDSGRGVRKGPPAQRTAASPGQAGGQV